MEVAVKVTVVLAQVGFVPERSEMATVGAGLIGFTVTVIGLLVPVGWLLQFTFVVRMQATTSRFAKVLVVKVALFVPAFAPFTCH